MIRNDFWDSSSVDHSTLKQKERKRREWEAEKKEREENEKQKERKRIRLWTNNKRGSEWERHERKGQNKKERDLKKGIKKFVVKKKYQSESFSQRIRILWKERKGIYWENKFIEIMKKCQRNQRKKSMKS